MSDPIEKVAGAMRSETDGNAVAEWYYSAGQERMDWPNDAARAAYAAVLDDLAEPSEDLLSECSNIENPEYGRIFTTPKNLRAVWQAMLAAKRREVLGDE